MSANNRVTAAAVLVAALMLALAGCGAPSIPAKIVSPEKDDTVWGTVTVKAEINGNLPANGVDFYIDDAKAGNVAQPVAGSKIYEYRWDVSALEPASEHKLGAVVAGGNPPQNTTNVKITSAPILAFTVEELSGSSYGYKIDVRTNWSTVDVVSLVFRQPGMLPSSDKKVWQPPLSGQPDQVMPLSAGRLLQPTVRDMIIVEYRSQVGGAAADSLAASPTATDTFRSMDPASPYASQTFKLKPVTP